MVEYRPARIERSKRVLYTSKQTQHDERKLEKICWWLAGAISSVCVVAYECYEDNAKRPNI